PTGDAWRRARRLLRSEHVPLATPVHGGVVLYTTSRVRGVSRAVERALRASPLVPGTSQGSAEHARTHGAAETRVVHLGADMPSTEEAFGVAYVEAMAGGVPAIGCRGEPGPEEIAAAGGGLVLVPPGDIERLSQRVDELLSDPQRLREARQRARATVAAHFTW